MKFIKRHRHFIFAIVLSLLTYIVFYGSFFASSHYFWGSDARTEYVPARVYLYDKVINEHTFPFWTEKMYSGFPIYADLENSYLNPINTASILIFGPKLSYKILHILTYLLGSLSLYFFLKRKDIGIWGFAAANAIFYFNTFSINHQIHFNVIMAFYLTPTAFLLADLFIEKRQIRYILLQSFVLANAFLWGHVQSMIIVSLGVFIYILVFAYKKISFSTFFFYFALLIFLIIIETLPQIIPTYELFSQSVRSSSLDYLKGSLNPRMAIFSFVPYLFGGYDNFVGKEINSGFTYTEIYTYLGISSIIISVLALLFLKKSRNIILSYIFIWIFLIFGFMEYNNMFPANTPLIPLFRDWVRTANLSSFGIALLVGIFIEKINKASFKNIPKGALFIFAPLVYILILCWIGEHGKISRKVSLYTSFDYIQTYPYFKIILAIAFFSIVTFSILLAIKKLFPHKYSLILLPAKIIIFGIIFFDLLYFSKDVLAFRLQDISDYKIASAPEELENKRSILRFMEIRGMESLYYDNWSPFGYSQFKESDYMDYFEKTGMGGDVRSSQNSLPKDKQRLLDLGIIAMANSKEIVYLNNNKLDMLKSDLEGDYIEKKEGKIVMQINSPSDTMVSTYLKYNPYWRVKVDGQKVDIAKNGIFFDFPLSQGNHLVEIKYIPKLFFVGLFASLILTFISILLYRLFKKPLCGKVLRVK